MSRRPARYTQADVARAVKGAKAAGLCVTRVEIDAEGKIVVISGPPDQASEPSELERWRAKKRAHST